MIWGLNPYMDKRFFSFPKCPADLAYPAFCSWVPGFFAGGVKQQATKLTIHVSSNAGFKNEWSCTSVTSICLHGMDRDNFTFTKNVDS
jgi:hypothetical protein